MNLGSTQLARRVRASRDDELSPELTAASHFDLASSRKRHYCWKMVENQIEIDPNVMMGKPVIRGTRITVELILRKLGEGATEADLLDAYPRLTREDIQAAMRYAADTLAHEEIGVVSQT